MAVTDFTCPQRALSTDRSHVPAMVELASVEARRGRSDRVCTKIQTIAPRQCLDQRSVATYHEVSRSGLRDTRARGSERLG